MAERVVVVAVDGSDQADKAFNCKYFNPPSIYLSNNMDEKNVSVS